MNTPQKDAGPNSDRGDAARLGRRIGIALFWLLLTYVISMSAISIIPSLYFPQTGPRPQGRGVQACARTIHALERNLVDRAADTLRQQPRGAALAWLSTWDARYLALPKHCGPLEGARKDLATLRQSVQALLSDYAAGPMQNRARIRRALQSLADDTGAPKS